MKCLTIFLVLLLVAMLIIAETGCARELAPTPTQTPTTNIIGFGDSIMAGACLSTTDKGFLDLIADYYTKSGQIGTQQLVVVNKARGGIQLDTMVNDFYASRYGSNAKLFALVGYNNMRVYGNDTDWQSDFKSKLWAVAAWSALPIGAVKLARDQTITYKGQWQNIDVYGGGLTKYSTRNGAKVEFELQGTILYIGMTDLNGQSGQVKVETRDISGEGSWIDKGTYECYGVILAPQRPPLPVPTPRLIRLTGYSGNGTLHDVRLTVVSPDGKNVAFDWAAGNTETRDFYLGECLPMSATGYTVPANHGSDAAVSNYNMDIADVANTLAGDGLKVHLVHASEYYNLSTDVCSDNVHPNELGHQHIAEAFIEQIGTTNASSNAE